jgi:hypothetical protein
MIVQFKTSVSSPCKYHPLKNLGVMESWSDEKNSILQFSNILILVS